MSRPARLALEDGTVFEGNAFDASYLFDGFVEMMKGSAR